MSSVVSQLASSNRGAIVRRLVPLVLVVLSAALSASPAHAAAVVVRLSASHTEVFPVDGYFCLPQRVGTATQTESSTGQFVTTGSGVFTFHGVDAYDLRIDFADGSYVQSGIDRDLISAVFHAPLTVFHVVTQDVETLYNAQGQPVGKIEIHAGSQLTFTDLNGNGQPDDGEVKVSFERFRLRCS
jgi:hypothetical protein